MFTSNVTVCGGTVIAKGGYDGAAIGGGQNGAGGTVTITDNFAQAKPETIHFAR